MSTPNNPKMPNGMRFAPIVLYTLKLEKAKGYNSANTVVLPSELVPAVNNTAPGK